MRRLALALVAVTAIACSDRPTAPTPVTTGGTPAPGGGGTSLATEVWIGAGDIGRCGSAGPEATAALLDRESGSVFTVGDNAYPNGRVEDFRDCYAPSWGRHRGRTSPAPGNHEYETAGAAGYFGYFGSRAGSADRGYYAYTLGAWRIIALNSEAPVSAGSAQAAWLRNELASSGAGCTAAYWHRPLMSSGSHGDNPDMRDLFSILYDAGVEFIVAGHDHLYERFAPMDPNGRPDSQRGVRQFTVGTGGTPISQPGGVRFGSEIQGYAWGVIRFELAPNGYRWQFLPVAGQSFQDSGFESCH